MKYAEPEIPLHCREKVVFVYAVSPLEFVLQLERTLDKLNALMQEISAHCESGQGKQIPESSLRLGTPCLARYSVDGQWYRAIVESISINSVGVYFVDYGNREHVFPTEVLEIRPQFMSLPAQGIVCNPAGAGVWSSHMRDSFFKLVNGCDVLQAVFLHKKGKVVDVILSDSADPLGESFNEKLGLKLEQLSNPPPVKPAVKQQASRTESLPQRTLSPGYKQRVFPPETCVDVIVSWFVSPDKFYCQDLSFESDFEEISEEIQRSRQHLSPLRGDIGIGTPVIANFPADGVLYRGEIKEQIEETSYLVEYVDYGNSEVVTQSDLWKMEARFLSFPRHAVLCALEGVKPVNSEWSPDLKEYVDVFGVAPLKCVFSTLQDGKYCVRLFLPGDESVATRLVQGHLAQDCQLRESQFDLELLPGQQLQVHIAFIESVSKFYVHLDPATAQEIQENIATHMQETQVKSLSPSDNLEKNSLCLASPDSVSWYRAKVLDVSSEGEVLVKFIDYGDTSKVPLHQVLHIPEPLTEHCPQATECFIFGSDQLLDHFVEEQFKTVEDQDVIVFVDSLSAGRLGVQVFRLDGLQLEMLTSPLLTVEPVCPMPVTKYTMNVSVSHVDGPRRVWLQSTASEPQLLALLDRLYAFYDVDAAGQPLDYPEEGDLCVARFSKDQSWYRARVTSVSDHGVSVLFIDYGNTDVVPFESVCVLGPSFFTPHALSLCASLPVEYEESLLERVFTASFRRDSSGAWSVNLLEADELAIVKETYSSVPLPPGMTSVHLSCYESPSDFYVQPASVWDTIIDFQQCLNNVVDNLQSVEPPFTTNTLCLAQFSFDCRWYRALIMESNASLVKVHFVDYGNVEEIDITHHSLKLLPKELREKPFFAVRCSLKAEDLTNSKQISLLEDLAFDHKEMIEIKVLDSGDPVTVRFVVPEEQEVAVKTDALDTRDPATVQCLVPERQEEAVKTDVLDTRDPAMVQCLVPERQEEAVKTDALDTRDPATVRWVIPERQEEAVKTDALDTRDPATVRWVIPEQQQEEAVKTDVLDTRDPATVRWVIPERQEEAVKTDVLDTRDPATVRWLVPEQQEVAVKTDVLDTRDPAMVQWLVPERHEVAVKTEGKCTWHVTTPAEFWVQDDADSPLLDEIGERLAEAASFPALQSVEEGTLCAALFPDDELWYRARVLKVSKKYVRVRYIDYGNSSLTTELRVLPPDLVRLPPVARYCQVTLPDVIYPRSANGTIRLQLAPAGDPLVAETKTEDTVFTSERSTWQSEERYEVTICHITSPQSFWVHLTEDVPLLREISSKLQSCEKYDPVPDPAAGRICAALFPEDELWYRAEILSSNENGIEVFFIDYGNSSLSPDVRLLPDELLHIPSLAKHCYLKLPRDWTIWPLAAEELFMNFCEDDSKRFQLTIVERGDPAGVSLSRDGICIVDVLGSI